MQLVVGRIGRAHGVRGEVTVEVRTDDPEHRFAVNTRLGTDPDKGTLTITHARPHSGRLLVAFAEVSDRTAAEALSNTLLVVDSETSATTADGEYWDHDLIGLPVHAVDDVYVGELTDVLHTAGGDLLVITREGRPELLVPFIAAFVPEVDLDGRRIVVDPPEGLADLDRAE